MRFKNPTAEEIDIEEAMDAHLESLKHEQFVFRVGLALYIPGFPLFIFGSGNIEKLGLVLVSAALFSMLYHFIVHLGTQKKSRKVKDLLDPYLRYKALPLLQDLRAKFADDPNINFILNDNGSITVIQKNENE